MKSNVYFTALALATLALSSQAALATSPAPTTDNGFGHAQANQPASPGAAQVSLNIDGDAARVLYMSLDVPAQGSFGIVQTQTKRTDHVQCSQAFLGDVPGQMAGPKYHCIILVDRR